MDLTDLPERLQNKITFSAATGCWLWHPVRKDGYTLAYWKGKRPLGHRLVWELLVGPIPEGLHLDHVAARGCTNKNCVNPAHLEPVTPLVNTRRAPGNATKTHCKRGHEFTEANTYYRPGRLHRYCRRCHCDEVKAAYHRSR
jgi:hypothetical protein